MLVANTQIAKIPPTQRQQCPVLRTVDLDCDEGRRHFREGAVPLPGVDEPPGWCHFEKLAADRDALSTADPAHFDPVGSAGAQIDFDVPGNPARRTPPFAKRGRLGPGTENAIGRSAEPSLQLDSRSR